MFTRPHVNQAEPREMMWSIVILLAAAFSVESYAVHDQYERFVHGRQLRIFLPKGSERLVFTPANDPNKSFVYWERGKLRSNRGKVSGTGSDRRWYIDKVTYADEGTYVQKDFWNKEISVVKVAVTYRKNYLKCVAGETLYISLEGINMDDAALSFSGDYGNVTLVRDGSRVSQDLPDYWDRVKTGPSYIEIKNVNYTDVGRYILRDQRGRVVSVTRMDLTDRHESARGSPLIALLLLLGIPAGICCCCRKKIFRSKSSTATVLQSNPNEAHPPEGPAGPCPSYNMYHSVPDPNMGPTVHPPPPTTGPEQWNDPPPTAGVNPGYPSVGPANPAYPSIGITNPGYPSAGPANPAYPSIGITNPGYPPAGPANPAYPSIGITNPGYPPAGPANPAYPSIGITNPGYPPAGPAMIPPAQPPQWNDQCYPGPAAPMGYAPVMYSSPPPADSGPCKEDIKMENVAFSPADPLLTAAPQNVSSYMAPVPPSTTSADDMYQIQINGQKSSSNFL